MTNQRDTKLVETQIKITGVEQKLASNDSVYFNLKDENNKTYKLWKLIQDGSESVAYKTFKTLPDNGLGKNLQVRVELQDGEYQGKPVVYRTIKAIAGVLPDGQIYSDAKIENKSDKSFAELAHDIKEANELQIRLLNAFTDKLSEVLGKDLEEEVKVNDMDNILF